MKFLLPLIFAFNFMIAQPVIDQRELAHFQAGVNISQLTGSLTYHATRKVWAGMLVSLVSSWGAGFFKEYVYDKQWGLGVCDLSRAIRTGQGGFVGTFCIPITVQKIRKINPEY